MSENDNKEDVASENTTTDEKKPTYVNLSIYKLDENDPGLVVECPRCGAGPDYIVKRWQQWVHSHVYATREKAWDTGATLYNLNAHMGADDVRFEDEYNWESMHFKCILCDYTSHCDSEFIVDKSDSEYDGLKVPVALTRLLPDGWREALQAAGLIPKDDPTVSLLKAVESHMRELDPDFEGLDLI